MTATSGRDTVPALARVIERITGRIRGRIRGRGAAATAALRRAGARLVGYGGDTGDAERLTR